MVIDRLVANGLLVLLAAGSFLAPFAGSAARVAPVVILGAVAFRAAVVRSFLSRDYRALATKVLRRAAGVPVHSIQFVLFVFLLLLALARAAQAGVMDTPTAVLQSAQWVSVLVVMVSVVLHGVRRGEGVSLLRAVVTAFLVLNIANTVLYFAGMQNEAAVAETIGSPRPGVLFGLLGLKVVRTPVALGGGFAVGAMQGAVGLALGLVMLWRGAGSVRRWEAALLAGTSAFVILLSDARGAMFAALGAASATLLLPSAVRSRAKWLALAVPVLPLLMLGLLEAVANQPWIADLSRGGTSSVSLLTGRPLIWASILAFLADFRVIHLFGYGAVGQVTSGVAAQYGIFFARQYASPYTVSAHNALLQNVLDVGYIGAFLQVALFWQLLKCFGTRQPIAHRGAWANEAGFCCTVCLLLSGLTETSLTYTAPGTLVLFLALNLHCLISGEAVAPAARAGGDVVPSRSNG